MWPLDVAGVWDHPAVSAPEVKDKVERWQVRLPVALALQQLRQLQGTLPPSAADLIDDLRHPWVTFSDWCRQRDRKHSPPGRLTPGRWIVRSTRTSGYKSALEAARYALGFPGREAARRDVAWDDHSVTLREFLTAVQSFTASCR